VKHLLRVENLIEILLELLSSLLDGFGAIVGDPEDLLLGKGGPS